MMYDNEYSPIAIFAYNRPDYLQQTLSALAQNDESKHSLIYIFCDGAKPNISNEEAAYISKTRLLAHSVDWCKELVVIESEYNKGLSNSILNGVEFVLNKHEKIIVLEDDLVVSKYFLNYLNFGLRKYEFEESVISIVGYNYPVKFPNNPFDAIFLKSTDCLGWATWRRGWNYFESDSNKLIDKIIELDSVKEFNFDNQYPFMKMLKNVSIGKTNSWAIRWYASAFVNQKLSLFPKKSLVRHIGQIGSNIKYDNTDLLGWEISNSLIINFPDRVVESENNRNTLAKHFRKYNRRRFSLQTIVFFRKALYKKINNIIKSSANGN